MLEEKQYWEEMAQTCNCTVAHKISQDRLEVVKKASQLAEKIRMLGGLSIKDRTYHFRTYKICFVASELVDWLVSSGEVETRSAAAELGQMLVDTDFIHHVVDEHYFEDAYLFFRFRQDGMMTKLFASVEKQIQSEVFTEQTLTLPVLSS